MIFLKILLVGMGGFIGAVFRYGASQWITKMFSSSDLPLATLTVNLAGSFLLGILIGLDIPSIWFLIFGTGVLGAFTTFSTLKLEAVQLHINQKVKVFLSYTLLSYIAGIALAYTGWNLGQWLL